MNLQSLPQLRQDISKVPRLHARRRGLRVAVHGVALPDGDVTGLLHSGDMSGQELRDLRGAVPGYQGDFSNFLCGIDGVEEGDQLGGLHARSDLDADGVCDAAEELDVGAVELPCSIADPEEVRGCCVEACWCLGLGIACACAGAGFFDWVALEPGEGLLVFEGETFVAGEDVCCFDAAVFVDANCAHEAEGVFDGVDGLGVLFFD